MKRCALILLFLATIVPSWAEPTPNIFETYWTLSRKKDDEAVAKLVQGLSQKELALACRQAHGVLLRELAEDGSIFNEMPRSEVFWWNLGFFVQRYALISFLPAHPRR